MFTIGCIFIFHLITNFKRLTSKLLRLIYLNALTIMLIQITKRKTAVIIMIAARIIVI